MSNYEEETTNYFEMKRSWNETLNCLKIDTALLMRGLGEAEDPPNLVEVGRMNNFSSENECIS